MSAKWSGANAVSCFYFHWNVSNWQDFLIVPRSGAYSAELSSRAQQLHPQSDSPESCTFTKKERNLSTAIYSLDSLYSFLRQTRNKKGRFSCCRESKMCWSAFCMLVCLCAHLSERAFSFLAESDCKQPYIALGQAPCGRCAPRALSENLSPGMGNKCKVRELPNRLGTWCHITRHSLTHGPAPRAHRTMQKRQLRNGKKFRLAALCPPTHRYKKAFYSAHTQRTRSLAARSPRARRLYAPAALLLNG